MSSKPRKSVYSPQPALANGMKGNLILKSSPFAPTQNSLNSQYLVLDHMNAHYRKVNTAKSAIDMSVPKAWLVSQKVRDQNRRAQQQKSKSRPPSGAKSVPSAQIQDDEDEDDFDPEIGTSREEMALIKNLIHETQQEKEEEEARMYAKNNGEDYDPYQNRRRPTASDMQLLDRMIKDSRQSPSSYKSPRPMASNIPDSREGSISQTQGGTPRRKQGGDLLDTRGHKFTEPQKPFTPRTLKSTKSSKLTQYKFYNPPPKKQVHKRRGIDPSVRGETPTDTYDLMDETLQSRDFSRLRQSGTVPPLDISLDADHMKWLKEQEKKAQVRAGSHVQHELELDHQRGSLMQAHGGPRKDRSNSYLDMTGKHQQQDSMSGSRKYLSRSNTSTMQRVKDEEDELKYLEFIKEVTNDVLERGIFTNRVLKQVFEHHIEKRKQDLKISRMRALVDTLREDLGIPEDDGSLDTDDVGMGTTTSVPPLVKPRSATLSNNHSANYEDEFDKDYLKLATRLQLEGGLDGSSSFNSQKNYENNVNNNNTGHGKFEYKGMNGGGGGGHGKENGDLGWVNGNTVDVNKNTYLTEVEEDGSGSTLLNMKGTYDRLEPVSEEVTPELTPKAPPRRSLHAMSSALSEEKEVRHLSSVEDDDKPKPSPRPRPRLQQKKTIEETDDDDITETKTVTTENEESTELKQKKTSEEADNDDDDDGLTKTKALTLKNQKSTDVEDKEEEPLDSDELLRQVSDKLSELKSDDDDAKSNIDDSNSKKNGALSRQSSVDLSEKLNKDKTVDKEGSTNPENKEAETSRNDENAAAASTRKDNDIDITSDFEYSEDEDQKDDAGNDENGGKSTARSDDDDF
ncbi:uncharacterized protein LOC106156514 [Lingula anatina]|uniref:Uncharacterized protein LOC106156514 n=1 Tax=Lingula anatina TaxID=7574 RepID=A0A1S3HNY0_LINAN|nr:uncharacterized protein LOC106156514 [Lingula anatina]|eukprot:XP_013387246.1 uncharacterized protein LOC106156514 [Lingula anatina]